MFPPELAPKSFQRFFVGLTLKDGDDSALKVDTSNYLDGYRQTDNLPFQGTVQY